MWIPRIVTLTCFLAVFATGLGAAPPGDGTVDAADFILWRSNLGTSVSETAEMFLSNRCRQTAVVKVTQLNISGQAGNDVIILSPGASSVIPLSLQFHAGGNSDRQYAAVVGSAPPGPCAFPGRNLIDRAVAIVGPDDSTRHMVRSDGELVQAVSDRTHATPIRVGAGQRVEIMASNTCEVPARLTFDVTEVATGETTTYQALVAPGQGHVVPLDEGHRGWIEIASFAWKPARSGWGICPPGQPEISASAHLVDPNGSTVAIALLLPAIQKASPD
jgi:hypothetical protein